MNIRKIVLLSAIAVFGCVYIIQLVTSGSDTVKTLKLAEQPDTLVISRGDGSSLTIAKDGERWLLGDKKYPADSARISGMISALDPVKILGTVSGSGDLERYGFEDAARVTITASKDGKTLRTVNAGKNSVTGQQSYAVIDGGKDVVLVSGSFRDSFSAGIDGLRDKAIWSIPSDGITRIEVDGAENGDFALAKAGDPAAWVMAAPEDAKSFALDAGKASSWAQGFANLKADSFAPDGTETGAAYLSRFTVTGGGKTLTLTIHAKEGDSKYLCSSSESPYPFYLTSSVAGKFLKPYKDLGKDAS